MQAIRSRAMVSPSVSFRISRSAEDLAGTLHLLSQRLVQLEQRLEALEGQRQASQQEDPALEKSLGNAERLLLDCRALLGGALDQQAGSVDRHTGSAGSVIHGKPTFEDKTPEGQGSAVEGDDGDQKSEGEISLFSNGPINSAAA
jgi:uncharacterized membrane protein YccC